MGCGGELEVVEALRFGELVRCNVCSFMLYLDGRGLADGVTADEVRFLRAWNATPQRLSPTVMETLMQALTQPSGGRATIEARVHRDMRGVCGVDVPCRVVLETETIDPVLVVFEPRAPLGKREVVSASSVVAIEGSRFTLTSTVQEAAMSDAPVLFRSSTSGRYLRLRKHALFVQEDGIDGRDVVVCWRDELASELYEQQAAEAPVVGHREARIVAVDLDHEARALFGQKVSPGKEL